MQRAPCIFWLVYSSRESTLLATGSPTLTSRNLEACPWLIHAYPYLYPMESLSMLATTFPLRVPQISRDMRQTHRGRGREQAKDAGGAVDHASTALLTVPDFLKASRAMIMTLVATESKKTREVRV